MELIQADYLKKVHILIRVITMLARFKEILDNLLIKLIGLMATHIEQIITIQMEILI